MEKYGKVKAYYEEHGNTRIPAKYETDGFRPYEWLRTQRRIRRKGKLAEDKIRLLEEIGVEW